MSKIFQIEMNICYWEASQQYSSMEHARAWLPEEIILVEAPDYVFEGWGYDPDAEGDARFIKPTPPEGWLYDDPTGSFYQEGTTPPSQMVYEELQSPEDYMWVAIANSMKAGINSY